ncbi:MAG: polyprenyl synthetase family protein [Archaeoglobaceae archaeon]|nr:polyprenyl synthetase family protein [Archaeoglobaceae archaeon]MDW7989993.1 polyprenyl synthetase family protein [Archaeoglobaceae archaeon]
MIEIQKRAGIVDEALKNYLPEKELELYKAARHLIKAGGKRLRPVIAMLICEVMGEDYRKIMPAIVAIEAIHNFTLIHDDIMDRDVMRRNVKTVHTLYGEPIAILAGDTLFAEAFSLITKCEVEDKNIKRAVEVIADVCIKICEGQFMDISFERDMANEKEYLEMVELKTGVLIAASASLPAILFGRYELFQTLWEYGINAGIGFQIHDDVLGLIGEDIGKDWGSDLVRGKKTLVVIKAFEKGVKLESFGKKIVNFEEIKRDVEKLKTCGAIDYARAKAKEYIKIAKKNLFKLDENEGRKILEALTDFLVERKK